MTHWRVSGGAALLGMTFLVSGCRCAGQVSPPETTSNFAGAGMPSVAFVVTCSKSHEANDDPLQHPGHPGASHRHAFFGSKVTSAYSKVADLQAADTSCNDPADTAAYWTPAPSGDNLRAYYDAGSTDPGAIRPYPEGLMGITGDPKIQEPGVDVAGFRCGSVGDGPDGAGWAARPPAADCATGSVIVRYSFGQCGEDRLVACRRNEAGQYPRLRLLLEWQQPQGGLGPHADFWNGWKADRLAELIAICIRGERATNLEIKSCRLPGT
jgi:hypothetical protein